MTWFEILRVGIFGIILFIISPYFINLLRRLGFYKTKNTEGVDISHRNPLWYNHLGDTLETPASYGILLLPIGVYFFIVGHFSIITTLAFVAIWSLGLYDDLVKYFLYKKTGAWGLPILPKLLLQLFATGTLLLTSGLIPFGVTFLLYFVILVFFINSYNITDGLDGLVASITLAILPVLYFLELQNQHNQTFLLLFVLLFVFVLVFFFYNRKPARVWLGDTGAMALGLLIGMAVVRYSFIPMIILFGVIFLEGLSSLIQIFAIRVLKRKVFKIAPLHLHLRNSGWSEGKIVTTAFLVQSFLSAVSVLVFVLQR